MRLRILYVGDLQQAGTCLQRMRAMRELGHQVSCLDTTQCLLPKWLASRIAKAEYHLFNWRVDLTETNRRLKSMISDFGEADVIWCDKPLTIRRATLCWIRSRMPNAVLVTYSPDDQLNPANHSRSYLRCLSCYDLVVTTKSYNVEELRRLGSRRVMLARVGFDPGVHRPVRVTVRGREEYGAQVSFVGTYENERCEYLTRLADEPFTLRVWGSGWRRASASGKLGDAIQGRPVYGDAYARAICASDVNLCFLRKAMRDRVTTRSVEIPACGGFMLAERSEEHLEYFGEDKEAVYFATFDELRAKIRHYLGHPKERARIAAAGRARCLRGGYSNQDRMRDVLLEVEKVREERLLGTTAPAE